jgi:PBSX family phage terminase large subunit
MTIQRTNKQERILKSWLKDQPKHLILEGAVRSGKTWLNNVLFWVLVKAHAGQGVHFIITGHTLASVKRNVLEPLGEQFGVDLRPDNAGTFSWYGNKVHCFGADKQDSYKAMTGLTAHGWLANEVSLQHPNTIAEAFSRVSGKNARVLWDTNPDYPDHPVKRQYIDRSGERLSNGKLHIQSWHFELEDNPFLPSDYVEQLKASTPPGMWYDRRIKGLWVAAEGLVYEHFDRETHVVEPFEIPADWKKVRAIDLGYENPFVMLWGALDPDGRLYIYREHYKSKTLIRDHVDEIERKSGDERYGFTVSDHDAQERAELHSQGLRTRPAQKDVSIGIQKVAERLVEQGDGHPRLYIMRNCENTIRELQKYRWQPAAEDKPAKEEPMKVDDHTADALRYMVMELDYSSAPKVTAAIKR